MNVDGKTIWIKLIKNFYNYGEQKSADWSSNILKNVKNKSLDLKRNNENGFTAVLLKTNT